MWFQSQFITYVHAYCLDASMRDVRSDVTVALANFPVDVCRVIQLPRTKSRL